MSVYGIELDVDAPRVRCRATVARAVDVDYTHKKANLPIGEFEFARVKLRIEPYKPGAGNVFRSEVVGGVIPDAYISGVEKGVQGVWDTGLLGFPTDLSVSLRDGAYHEIDSSLAAFEIAARSAMREGLAQAGARLLEPVMDVWVVTPSEFVGSVIDDLNGRHGRIRDQKRIVDTVVISATAPLAHLLGYSLALSSTTKGRARSRMRFREYIAMPGGDGPDGFAPAVGMRA